MPLTDRKLMTFDVVGTLIDFETGILDYIHAKAKQKGLQLTDQAILEAYAVAEDRQHHETPRLPFPSMMAPMYREMAAKLGLPDAPDDVEGFRLSIPRWPAFPDSVAALKRLRRRFRLVAMTNSDNWALSNFARTLELPFDDMVTAEMVGWNKPDPQVFAFTRGRQSMEGYGFDDISACRPEPVPRHRGRQAAGLSHLLDRAAEGQGRRRGHAEDGGGGDPRLPLRLAGGTGRCGGCGGVVRPAGTRFPPCSRAAAAGCRPASSSGSGSSCACRA